MSSRRIPKGPGRRPKSLARRQFMELIARGWPLATAAKEVGISRGAAYLWRDGATVRDKNGSVRHVAPLRTTSPETDLSKVFVRRGANTDSRFS